MYRIARLANGKVLDYYRLGTIKGKRIQFVEYGPEEEAKVIPALEPALWAMSYLRGKKRKFEFQIEQLFQASWVPLDRSRIK
jgi:hypothetical protein